MICMYNLNLMHPDTCLNATVYQKSYTPSIKTKPQINPIALEKVLFSFSDIYLLH